MSPDLHPEELLDKAAAGTLSDTERAWLDQHLSSCAVCRFEQAARADFAAAAAPVAKVQVDDLVARALAGLPAKEAPSFSKPRRRLPYAVAAAVALFGMASFAAVGQWTGVLPRLVEQLWSPALPPGPQPAVVPRAATARAPVVDPELPVANEVPVPEAVEPAPAPVPAPVAVALAPRPAKRPAVTAPRVGEALDASALFAFGNAARIRGDRAEAALRYRELLSSFPASAEARLTHATLGRMLLDLGDAKGALSELEAYLQLGDGALREEAMSARARALALLGREADEARAWQALLASYPESVHAERARARLVDLGER